MDALDFLSKELLYIFSTNQLNKIEESGLVLCLIRRIDNKTKKLITIDEKLYKKKDYRKKIEALNNLGLESTSILLNDPNNLEFTLKYLFLFYLANFINKVHLIGSDSNRFNEYYIEKITKMKQLSHSGGSRTSNNLEESSEEEDESRRSSYKSSSKPIPSTPIALDVVPLVEVIGETLFDKPCNDDRQCEKGEGCIEYTPSEEQSKKGKFCHPLEKLKISSVKKMGEGANKRIRFLGKSTGGNIRRGRLTLLILILLSLLGNSGVAGEPTTAAAVATWWLCAGIATALFGTTVKYGVDEWKLASRFQEEAQPIKDLIATWGGTGKYQNLLDSFEEQTDTNSGVKYYHIKPGEKKMISTIRENILSRLDNPAIKKLDLSEYTDMLYDEFIKEHVKQIVDLQENIAINKEAVQQIFSADTEAQKKIQASKEKVYVERQEVEQTIDTIRGITDTLDEIITENEGKDFQRKHHKIQGVKHTTGLYFKIKEFVYDAKEGKIITTNSLTWNDAKKISSGSVNYKSGIDFIINHSPDTKVFSEDKKTYSLFRLSPTEIDELSVVGDNVKVIDNVRMGSTALVESKGTSTGKGNNIVDINFFSGKNKKSERATNKNFDALKRDLKSIEVEALKQLHWKGKKKENLLTVVSDGLFFSGSSTESQIESEKEIQLMLSFAIPLIEGIGKAESGGSGSNKTESVKIQHIKSIKIKVGDKEHDYYNPESHIFEIGMLTNTFAKAIISRSGDVIGGKVIDFTKFGHKTSPSISFTLYEKLCGVADEWFKPLPEKDASSYDSVAERDTFLRLFELVEEYETTDGSGRSKKGWFVPKQYQVPTTENFESVGDNDWLRKLQIADKKFVSLMTQSHVDPKEREKVRTIIADNVVASEGLIGKWEEAGLDRQQRELLGSKTLLIYIKDEISELKKIYDSGVPNKGAENYIKALIEKNLKDAELVIFNYDLLIAPIISINEEITRATESSSDGKLEAATAMKLTDAAQKRFIFGIDEIHKKLNQQNRKILISLHDDKWKPNGSADYVYKQWLDIGGAEEAKRRKENAIIFRDSYNKLRGFLDSLYKKTSNEKQMKFLTRNLISNNKASKAIAYNVQTFEGMPLNERNKIPEPLWSWLIQHCVKDSETASMLNAEYESAIDCLKAVYDLKNINEKKKKDLGTVQQQTHATMAGVKAIDEITREMEKGEKNRIEMVEKAHELHVNTVLSNQEKRYQAGYKPKFMSGISSLAVIKEDVIVKDQASITNALGPRGQAPLQLKGGKIKKKSRKGKKNKKKIKSMKSRNIFRFKKSRKIKKNKNKNKSMKRRNIFRLKNSRTRKKLFKSRKRNN